MALDLRDPEHVEALFTHGETYRFSRWNRPIAPVVFGVDDESLAHIKEVMTNTISVSGHPMVETDPEIGVNFMWFFLTKWEELLEVPELHKTFPDLPDRVARLNKEEASTHRVFAFEGDGEIRQVALFYRMTDKMEEVPLHFLAMAETFRALLFFRDDVFTHEAAIAMHPKTGQCAIKPEYAALLKAAYDTTMPAHAVDASHALRLAARIGVELDKQQK